MTRPALNKPYMRKAQITRLFELTHISYQRRFTDKEAKEYSDLNEEYENWVEGISKIIYDKMFEKFAFRFNELGLITTYMVWNINLKNQWGYSYNNISIMVRKTLKHMIRLGKAKQIKNTTYEIIRPLKHNI